MPKRWRIRPHDADGIARLGREAGVSSVVAQLLICRGICDPSAAKEFLDPKISGLRDPELLPGLTAAADRLHAAVKAGKSITVYGDLRCRRHDGYRHFAELPAADGCQSRFLRAQPHRRRLRAKRRSPAHTGPARNSGGNHRRLRHSQRKRSSHGARTGAGIDHHRPSRNGRRTARCGSHCASALAGAPIPLRRAERRRGCFQNGLGPLPARLRGKAGQRIDAQLLVASGRNCSGRHRG